ncbi:hypothetical protein BHE90_017057 [Fusarium euwallaceae]|uniref:Uncharacterized protein n=1 Tax=Fusarium euwallaceae TaxID=1147111 RepID=A0A430KYM6_9HYPO|nr:hypothetical protein BHE90_017057 [Fusarium euwallaceae]
MQSPRAESQPVTQTSSAGLDRGSTYIPPRYRDNGNDGDDDNTSLGGGKDKQSLPPAQAEHDPNQDHAEPSEAESGVQSLPAATSFRESLTPRSTLEMEVRKDSNIYVSIAPPDSLPIAIQPQPVGLDAGPAKDNDDGVQSGDFVSGEPAMIASRGGNESDRDHGAYDAHQQPDPPSKRRRLEELGEYHRRKRQAESRDRPHHQPQQTTPTSLNGREGSTVRVSDHQLAQATEDARGRDGTPAGDVEIPIDPALFNDQQACNDDEEDEDGNNASLCGDKDDAEPANQTPSEAGSRSYSPPAAISFRESLTPRSTLEMEVQDSTIYVSNTPPDSLPIAIQPQQPVGLDADSAEHGDYDNNPVPILHSEQTRKRPRTGGWNASEATVTPEVEDSGQRRDLGDEPESQVLPESQTHHQPGECSSVRSSPTASSGFSNAIQRLISLITYQPRVGEDSEDYWIVPGSSDGSYCGEDDTSLSGNEDGQSALHREVGHGRHWDQDHAESANQMPLGAHPLPTVNPSHGLLTPGSTLVGEGITQCEAMLARERDADPPKDHEDGNSNDPAHIGRERDQSRSEEGSPAVTRPPEESSPGHSSQTATSGFPNATQQQPINLNTDQSGNGREGSVVSGETEMMTSAPRGASEGDQDDDNDDIDGAHQQPHSPSKRQPSDGAKRKRQRQELGEHDIEGTLAEIEFVTQGAGKLERIKESREEVEKAKEEEMALEKEIRIRKDKHQILKDEHQKLEERIEKFRRWIEEGKREIEWKEEELQDKRKGTISAKRKLAELWRLE